MQLVMLSALSSTTSHTGVDALFIAILGALAAAAGGIAVYLVSRRQYSGNIDTTEAATLWTESKAMREELRAEVQSLREQLVKDKKIADERIAELEEQLEAAEAQTIVLRREVAQLRRVTGTTRQDVGALRREVVAAKALKRAEDVSGIEREDKPSRRTAAKKSTPRKTGNR